MKRNWKIRVIGVILINLIIAGNCCFGQQPAKEPTVPPSGVSVEIKVQDAEELRMINTLTKRLAGAESEIARLKAENAALKRSSDAFRHESLELIDKYQRENEGFRSLQLVLSGALSQGNVQSAGQREGQLADATRLLTTGGGALALAALQFSELVESVSDDIPEGKIRKTELALSIDRLRNESRRFIRMANLIEGRPALEKCRILSVDPDLSLVILPVGRLHGAFHGLLLYTGKKTTLKVISVRPFVSAAVVFSGDISELSPGMEVRNGRPGAAAPPEKR